jgi:polar amino acid transport system substrate-binding protein
MKRSAIEAKYELLPWARAYEQALKMPGHCVYSTTLTEARKPLFKWVQPIVSNNWVLYTAAGSSAPAPASLDAVKGKRIGGYIGDATAIWLKEQGHDVDEAQRDDLNPKKLEAGRIDYWASGERLAPIMAREAGVAIKPVLTIRQTVLGLACNEAVPAATVDKLNAALAAARDDGTLGKIEATWR